MVVSNTVPNTPKVMTKLIEGEKLYSAHTSVTEMYQTIPGHNELQYYIIFSLMLKLVLILINVCQYIEIKSVGFVFGPLCGLDNEKAEKP